ncbi:type II toxin-antitoxin system mRNA interferase toxin, RelE/StbE family [Methanoregula sp.]|uniref:type II toxin-antitoxin system RelE/ParE family toxin n=1 Tax=Methanoregula sp. TaxID=2052170 RepID=UPI000CB5F557|nr:type II toxin-antitoxin system mRNA interferase toxin, RelE/StbE family [Methanoregula sp.]PKG31521.1 MAG: type II toxin-antitoxin system mRNA interferase toxin, RelE/StbE family [Methanoregula sp.]
MVELIWDEHFKKLYTKWVRQHPELKALFAKKIVQFAEDPFHPSLKTHSLSGVLKGLWSFRITYEHRLVFDFLDKHRTKVLLIDIGSHKEVY